MNFDILVIGGGGAGLAAALEAAQSGMSVGLLSKLPPKRSQSVMAQGGINAALGNVESDSVQAHIDDTLKGAAGLGDETAVRILCETAPEVIAWLDGIGTPFNRTADARIDQRSFGGASRKRTCFSGDMTGHAIIHTLYDQTFAHENITVQSDFILLELLKDRDAVRGARFVELATGSIVTVHAKAVILATGGYAGIFYDHTTNTPQATGEGIVAALNAGAMLRDMEFVQFHPTTLKKSSRLISEAARGAGATLINDRGERFVNELATRDAVTKAIQAQLDAGGEVFLDMRHLDPGVLNRDLHHEVRLCRIYEEIDPLEEPVPVKPSAHYTMGGVAVDERAQVRAADGTIPGLYACGEVACSGAHGANRLGGNSLLDLLVFGRIAAREAVAHAAKLPDCAQAAQAENIGTFLNKTNHENFYLLREELGKIMERDASVLKDSTSLQSAREELEKIQARFAHCGITDPSPFFNTNLVEYLEFSAMLACAVLYVEAALRRTESRGSHLRRDFPQSDPDQAQSMAAFKSEGTLFFKPY
jgi:succinate dehydrogenase / fumarate reductase flavoprotein subunit